MTLTNLGVVPQAAVPLKATGGQFLNQYTINMKNLKVA